MTRGRVDRCATCVRRRLGRVRQLGYESNPATQTGYPRISRSHEQGHSPLGVERRISDALRLRAELSVILQGDADVVQLTHRCRCRASVADGTYEDTRVYMIGLARTSCSSRSLLLRAHDERRLC